VHPVDVAIGLIAVAWLVYAVRITRDHYFWADDLRLLEQAGSLGGLFEPYNTHMSLTILSIYRAAAEIGSLSYTPFMVAGLLCTLAIPVTYYATTRRLLGATLAALLALPLFWTEGLTLRTAEINHTLVLLGGIVCAAALNRGRRADGVLLVALAFALCSAGGGVVVAGACAVHNLIVGAPRRRWLVVLVPTVTWAGWWLLVGRDDRSDTAGYGLSVVDAAAEVRDLVLSPFHAAAYGNRLVAYALLGGFLAWGAWQLRGGLRQGANFLAWSAADVVWAAALVQNRGVFVDDANFRYRYVALGFVLLAVVPRRPIRWPERMVGPGWARAVAALGVLALAGVAHLAARSEVEATADVYAAQGRSARASMLVIGLGPEVVPDDAVVRFFGVLNTGTADRLRAIVDRYDAAFDGDPGELDRRVVGFDVVQAQVGAIEQHPGCVPLEGPLTAPPGGPGSGRPPVALWSPDPLTVQVRRFGEEWVPLVQVPAGRVVRLGLPRLHADQPWEIEAEGACELSRGG
jgi:hypothetical protein